MTANSSHIELPLSGKAVGRVVLVDATWREFFATRSVCLASHGYALTRGPQGGQVLVHRLVTGCVTGDGMTVDHINHDILDNRSENLRVSNSRSINSANKHLGPDRGVYWRADRWEARAQVNGQQFYLGRFMNKAEAQRIAHEFRVSHLVGYPDASEDAEG